MIQLWNDQRSQPTRAQLHYVITRAFLSFLMITVEIVSANTPEKLLSTAFHVIDGAVGNLTHFAIMREDHGIVGENSNQTKLGQLPNGLLRERAISR